MRANEEKIVPMPVDSPRYRNNTHRGGIPMNKQPANQPARRRSTGRAQPASAEGIGWGRDLTAPAASQLPRGRDQAVARHWTEGDKAVAPGTRRAKKTEKKRAKKQENSILSTHCHDMLHDA